jgi:hypothetical protein
MYKTIHSPVSVKADAAQVRPGVVPNSAGPVLCLAEVAMLVYSAAIGAAVNAAENGADDSNADSACTEAASEFATSALYLPPGRMQTGSPVRDDASVDELIAATRAA